MDALREIQIIDLLRLREEQWQKIAAAEAQIRALLDGYDYPFSAPPDLPSARRVKKKRLPRAKKTARQPDSGVEDKLRELLPPHENAYRIVYLYNGSEKESFQDDYAFVKQLLDFPEEAFQIKSIESVLYRSAHDWQKQELLWCRAPD